MATWEREVNESENKTYDLDLQQQQQQQQKDKEWEENPTVGVLRMKGGRVQSIP